jgi:uncharacterized membrane protein SirB2
MIFFLTFKGKYLIMEISNFWFYTIMIVVILHVIVGFVYLLYKLSPGRKRKQRNG